MYVEVEICTECTFGSDKFSMNIHKINSYVIKNDHIDCEKHTYDVLNDSIDKLLKDEMKNIIHEDMFIYFILNED